VTILPDGRTLRTPAGSLDSGFGALAARVGRTFTGEGVVLLDASAAAAVGVVADEIPEDGTTDHPVIADAQDAGWTISGPRDDDGHVAPRIGPWTTLYGRKNHPADVHVVFCGAPGTDDWDLSCDDPADTLAALALWHDLTGSAFLMTPGVAGLQVLRAMHPLTSGQAGVAWRSDGPDGGFESIWTPRLWHREPDGAYVHQYDARRAGLAAAIVTPLCRYRLRRRFSATALGRECTYDPKQAGWWHVRVPEWNHPHMPHPAGPDWQAGHAMWLTAPTMNLLAELTDAGKFAGVGTEYDSWTGPAGRPLLRSWGERMRDAYDEADRRERMTTPAGDPHPGSRVAGIVRQAVKQAAARETVGMFNAGTSVNRPDWYYSVVAQKRANMWRKAWTIGQKTHRWPVCFDDDNVYYASDEADAKLAAPTWTGPTGNPAGIVLGEKLGQMSHKGTRKVSDGE
jgi:hypothetical protein